MWTQVEANPPEFRNVSFESFVSVFASLIFIEFSVHQKLQKLKLNAIDTVKFIFSALKLIKQIINMIRSPTVSKILF